MIIETLMCLIVGVADGDTVTARCDDKTLKIRLAGIDAPEKSQPFGQASKQALARLVFGKEVKAECGKTDRYGRQICKLVLFGVDANLAQIKAGLAWHYKQYEREQSAQDRSLYEEAERTAKGTRSGLWLDPDSVPPWTWRREVRSSRSSH